MTRKPLVVALTLFALFSVHSQAKSSQEESQHILACEGGQQKAMIVYQFSSSHGIEGVGNAVFCGPSGTFNTEEGLRSIVAKLNHKHHTEAMILNVIRLDR